MTTFLVGVAASLLTVAGMGLLSRLNLGLNIRGEAISFRLTRSFCGGDLLGLRVFMSSNLLGTRVLENIFELSGLTLMGFLNGCVALSLQCAMVFVARVGSEPALCFILLSKQSALLQAAHVVLGLGVHHVVVKLY